ncbi:MAG: DUF1573 domain-containing protein [Prevotellaceae bacterium]|jgi:hypothetical protein|nr:DUF1573 domain-containing protein [Prevotellaceae bacterium]
MTKFLKTSIAFVIASFATVGSAQIATFEKTVHDFGTVPESVGSLVYEFKFTNTGDKPLKIIRVTASCGCTTPGWTKEPVRPGESGMVSASYGAKGRTYPFDKTLTVFTDGQPKEITLHIKGVVTAQPVDIRKEYPDSVGSLRVKNFRDLSFPLIDASKSSTTQRIDVANPLKETISISFENVPAYLQVVSEPVTLDSQQKGAIKIYVDGTKRKNYGYAKDAITLKAGNVKRIINVSSIVAEVFPSMSGFDIDKGPRTVVESEIDFGTGKDARITFKNDGGTDLIVKSFTTTNSSITPSSSKSLKIKPGKSAEVKLTFKGADTSGLNGSKIYFGTNDPRNSLVEISVKAGM